MTALQDLEDDAEVWKFILELSQDTGHRLYVFNKKATGIAIAIRNEMGLPVRYELAPRALSEHLRTDPDTLLLEINGRDDETALNAVREWVAEFAN